MSTPPGVSLVRGLVAAAADDTVDAARLYDRFTAPTRDALVRRFQTGGDPPDDDTAHAVADAVLGALTFWSLLPDKQGLDAEVASLAQVLAQSLQT